ncbi:MAG: nitroreductase family protein [Planctomycetota bacterium]|jgi:nitroreductase
MFMQLIQKRRSIRKYQNKKVEAEKIELLVEAALRAPSSRSFNPWQFIVIDDPALLEKLARAKPHGATFLKDAPLGIVVCGDAEKSDAWIEDCSIASIFIHLAAESLELGSCWIQIRERMHDKDVTADAYIAGLLDIPPNFRIESIIAVGYPDKIKPPHERKELQDEKVHLNRFGTPHPSAGKGL